MDKEKAEAEFGDVMFSLINAARLYKINPDNALELTNQKFIRRFNYLEEHTIKEGKNLKDMSLEEMDAIWNEAKRKDCNTILLPYGMDIIPVQTLLFPLPMVYSFSKATKIHPETKIRGSIRIE